MGSDLVERAAPPPEIFVCIKNGAISVGNSTEMSTDRDDVAGHVYGDEETVRYVLPAAEPERADVATLERVRAVWESLDRKGWNFSEGRDAIDAMLTEARAKPAASGEPSFYPFGTAVRVPRVDLGNGLLPDVTAAPTATAGEYEGLLRRLDERAKLGSWESHCREAATALRQVLGDLTEAQRDIVATAQVLGMRAKLWDLPSNEKRAVALLERAEKAEADLAREREAHEETRQARAKAEMWTRAHIFMAERDAARAEVERLRATPADQREDLRCVISDLTRQCQERKAEVDRLRAAAEPVRWGDVDGLAEVYWSTTGLDRYRDVHPVYMDGLVHVADALARALLTEGALDVFVAEARTWYPGTRDATRIDRSAAESAMRAALAHAGANVEAEPVADELRAAVDAILDDCTLPNWMNLHRVARNGEPPSPRSVVVPKCFVTEAQLPQCGTPREEPAAEGRPCPVPSKWLREWEQAADGDGGTVSQYDMMKRCNAWLVAEVRRLGGGGR